MRVESRYENRWSVFLLDILSSFLCLPFYFTAIYGITSFYQTTREKRETGRLARMRDVLLVGPLLLTISLFLLPCALLGWLLWILLNTLIPSRSFSIVSFGNSSLSSQTQTNFTFASMNVLLGSELVNKFNNLDSTFTRLEKISNAILEQTNEILSNLIEEEKCESKEQAVFTHFPHVDFICFQ